MNALPVLVKNSIGMELVEVDGQAVITAKNMADSLDYENEKAIHVIFSRNKESFKDGGIRDLVRGFQSETPCLKPCDTFLVCMLTSGRSDGQGGGGLQEVRVFTKRGALKVCMKSNQPKAVIVRDMLIDLYEKVESGQLMGAERFGRILEALTIEMSSLKKDLAYLKSRSPVAINLPDDTALPISLERKSVHRPQLSSSAFKSPEVRDLTFGLLSRGKTYLEIIELIKEEWPDNPEMWPSKSAVSRFYLKVKKGEYKEFGLDMRVH
jgi:hypothetical protein